MLDVAEIRGRSCPPSVEQQKICKRCSYFDLCFI
ncbi:MAG: Dna2/Cas4 domain-containing protein [Lachnospiraceae bacterium]